jgi:orotidine-5'-phosphate decarboxylase
MELSLMTISPVIVALDYSNAEVALNIAKQLDPTQCRVKVGKELFTAAGPTVVESLQKLGFDVFLDLKFHDIPNTTAKACLAAAKLGVWMLNVHASGGPAMMDHVVNELSNCERRPLLIAVTVLTSMDEAALTAIGYDCSVQDQVLHLARLAKTSGLDGVVCSAQEAQYIKEQLGADFKRITPGIRPLFAAADDQKRIVTPAKALALGSDYLVIGRAITSARDPLVALERIMAEIQWPS